MQRIKLSEIEVLKFDRLNDFSTIKHFITSRKKSDNQLFSLSLSSVENINPVIENRKILARQLQIPEACFVFQQQEHTSNISIVRSDEKGKSFYSYKESLANNDGMLSNEKEICLVVMGADCVPLLFYDPVNKVIGAAHAGWRGTLKGIAMEMIRIMKNQFSSKPGDILVGIGPSVGPESYEVDFPVYHAFNEVFKDSDSIFKPGKTMGKYLLNLWKANQEQLITAGIKPENIETSGICTYLNNDLFFSARKGDTGRFAAGIMLVGD